jgi:tetratricopeptide (TPR) repeat protein
MSSRRQEASVSVEPFEDRIDSLFRELELAVKWQRPSILFAIYRSEPVHADAEMALEGRLIDLGQKVFRLQVKSEDDADLAARLAKVEDRSETVFFAAGLRWGGGRGGMGAYAALNKHREYFVDNQVRIVFWLTEAEAVDLANHAPDYWAFRHRVIEFVDAPRDSQTINRSLETAWQGAEQTAGGREDIDARISLRESLLTGLPEGDEATAANANLHLTLGILHWRRGDQEKAARFLRSALETAIASEDKWFEAECLNAIALVYTDLGQIDEAIEAYKQAIHLAPGQIFPWNNLGNLYSKLERNDEAVAAFQKATEHSPEDAFSWNGLGNVYLKMDRDEDAVAAYRRAIELAPNFVYPWNGLGNAYAALGQVDEAIDAYQKAVGFNHHLTNPLVSLGNLYDEQGRGQDAIHAYHAALEVDPSLAHVWNGLGNVYFKMGSYIEAAMAYEEVIALAPELGWPYGNLGLAYCALGKYAKAVPLYQKAIGLLSSPKDQAITWNRLGDACRYLGDRKNAMAAFQKAVELDAVPAGLEQPAEAAAPAREEAPQPDPVPAADLDLEAVAAVRAQDLPKVPQVPQVPEVAQVPQVPDEPETPEAVEAPAVALRAAAPEDEADEWGGEPEAALSAAAGGQSVPGQAPDEDVYDLHRAGQAGRAAEETGTPQAVDGLPADAGEPIAQPVSRSANEWNELGHSQLNAGAYDDAISAYIKAIEMAEEFSWPYIHNLAMAHYHKGEHRGKGSKPAAAVARGREADLPQRYAEPPTQPLPAVAPRSAVQEADEETGEETGSLEGYAGHSLQYDASSTPDEAAALVPPVETPAVEMGAWLRELEEEQTASVNRSRAMDPEPEAGDVPVESPQPEAREQAEPSGLDDTVQTPARPRKAVAAPAASAASEPEQAEAAQAVEPRDALEWNELGNIQLKAGACDRAINAYVKAIEMQPDFGWPYSNLGLAYSHKGKYAEAVPLYRKSIELLKSSKEKAIAWNRMGDAYRRLNDHEQAAAAYQQAVELDSGGSSLLKRMRLTLLGNARA